MTLAVRLMLLCFPAVSLYECYWGVDGYNDHPLWKKECHDSQCIKIVDEPGVVTYNCDTTAYCRKTGCASNHLGGKTCCCDGQLCNSSAHSLFSIVFLVCAFFCLLNG